MGLPLRGRPILLITRMITDGIGLHSVLLPLYIIITYLPQYSPIALRHTDFCLVATARAKSQLRALFHALWSLCDYNRCPRKRLVHS